MHDSITIFLTTRSFVKRCYQSRREPIPSGFWGMAGAFWAEALCEGACMTIPDDRVLPMLDAIQEELRWRKRSLSEEEFRNLAKKICDNA